MSVVKRPQIRVRRCVCGLYGVSTSRPASGCVSRVEGSFHLQAHEMSQHLSWPKVLLFERVFQEVLGEGDQAGADCVDGAPCAIERQTEQPRRTSDGGPSGI